MKRSIAFVILALVVVAIAVLLATLLAPRPLYRDPPRDLPWELPDYRGADTGWHIDERGRIHAYVEHFFLEGISPAMVAWFYQKLPISTVEYRGRRMPLYHIFHPSEHGRLRVVEPASSGRRGMAAGALIEREEWFGPYDSRGAARLETFSDTGMVAVPEVAGLGFGRVQHRLRAEGDGTAYRVDAVIGSDLPVLGVAINYYLRTRVFHPAMMTQWQRHQVEEVASLQFFLPELYAQRGGGNHFLLSTAEAFD